MIDRYQTRERKQTEERECHLSLLILVSQVGRLEDNWENMAEIHSMLKGSMCLKNVFSYKKGGPPNQIPFYRQ
jgi:hypothetical protein